MLRRAWLGLAAIRYPCIGDVGVVDGKGVQVGLRQYLEAGGVVGGELRVNGLHGEPDHPPDLRPQLPGVHPRSPQLRQHVGEQALASVALVVRGALVVVEVAVAVVVRVGVVGAVAIVGVVLGELGVDRGVGEVDALAAEVARRRALVRLHALAHHARTAEVDLQRVHLGDHDVQA
eukprot:1195566-Prorocentrum_minimum.AAC.3